MATRNNTLEEINGWDEVLKRFDVEDDNTLPFAELAKDKRAQSFMVSVMRSYICSVKPMLESGEMPKNKPGTNYYEVPLKTQFAESNPESKSSGSNVLILCPCCTPLNCFCC